MGALPFRKMHGLGNDFVVLDARARAVPLTPARARALADRKRGIGCDQLISLEPSSKADVFMRIHNADGGEVEACGNATRCIARLLMTESGRDRVVVETVVGLLDCRGGSTVIQRHRPTDSANGCLPHGHCQLHHFLHSHRA